MNIVSYDTGIMLREFDVIFRPFSVVCIRKPLSVLVDNDRPNTDFFRYCLAFEETFKHGCYILVCLQCFDTVVWVSRRKSGL